MTPPENCNEDMCDRSADRAVRKVFAILGVDIDRPESIEEFREDLRFGKKMRRVADHGMIALIGVIVAGFAYATWYGLVTRIKGGTP